MKRDSMWRDPQLTARMATWGVTAPLPGMELLMVEYDLGKAAGLINYLPKGTRLPRGTREGLAYSAAGRLGVPFLTAVYDTADWSFQVFGHNDDAITLVGFDWAGMTEYEFISLLYRLRGRKAPSEALLASMDVPAAVPTLGASWAGCEMSARRRGYEPDGEGISFRMVNPCADIDFAVVGSASRDVTLLVEFKLSGAVINLSHPTMRALSRLGDRSPVAALVVEYDPRDSGWLFSAACLNEAASLLLKSAVGYVSQGWTDLNEANWMSLLDTAARR